MTYTMQDIMNQAMEDEFSANLNGKTYTARLLYGCKISQDAETKEIQILNTSLGGEWYSKVDNNQINIFLEKGWRIGVYELSLSNYRLKLDKIELSVKKEMNGRRNPKQIQSLKSARENILRKYSKIKYKLNQESNGKIKNGKH
tara:strand:- start:1757 stop:2188 length:432 start_codon:yes stop_codon:yes gene_type:complete